MGRPQMTAAQRYELGRAVRQARAGKVAWKTLEGLYGRSRAQLWRYAAEQMQHLSPQMQHLDSCGAESR